MATEFDNQAPFVGDDAVTNPVENGLEQKTAGIGEFVLSKEDVLARRVILTEQVFSGNQQQEGVVDRVRVVTQVLFEKYITDAGLGVVSREALWDHLIHSPFFVSEIGGNLGMFSQERGMNLFCPAHLTTRMVHSLRSIQPSSTTLTNLLHLANSYRNIYPHLYEAYFRDLVRVIHRVYGEDLALAVSKALLPVVKCNVDDSDFEDPFGLGNYLWDISNPNEALEENDLTRKKERNGSKSPVPVSVVGKQIFLQTFHDNTPDQLKLPANKGFKLWIEIDKMSTGLHVSGKAAVFANVYSLIADRGQKKALLKHYFKGVMKEDPQGVSMYFMLPLVNNPDQPFVSDFAEWMEGNPNLLNYLLKVAKSAPVHNVMPVFRFLEKWLTSDSSKIDEKARRVVAHFFESDKDLAQSEVIHRFYILISGMAEDVLDVAIRAYLRAILTNQVVFDFFQVQLGIVAADFELQSTEYALETMHTHSIILGMWRKDHLKAEIEALVDQESRNQELMEIIQDTPLPEDFDAEQTREWLRKNYPVIYGAQNWAFQYKMGDNPNNERLMVFDFKNVLLDEKKMEFGVQIVGKQVFLVKNKFFVEEINVQIREGEIIAQDSGLEGESLLVLEKFCLFMLGEYIKGNQVDCDQAMAHYKALSILRPVVDESVEEEGVPQVEIGNLDGAGDTEVEIDPDQEEALTVDISDDHLDDLESAEELVAAGIRCNNDNLRALLEGEDVDPRSVVLFERVYMGKEGYIYERCNPDKVEQAHRLGSLVNEDFFVMTTQPHIRRVGYHPYELNWEGPGGDEIKALLLQRSHTTDRARLAFEMFLESGIVSKDVGDLDEVDATLAPLIADENWGNSEKRVVAEVIEDVSRLDLDGLPDGVLPNDRPFVKLSERRIGGTPVQLLHRMHDQQWLDSWLRSQVRVLRDEIKEIRATEFIDGKKLSQEEKDELIAELEQKIAELPHRVERDARKSKFVGLSRPKEDPERVIAHVRLAIGVMTDKTFHQGNFISITDFAKQDFTD